jgi:hypothetical protein
VRAILRAINTRPVLTVLHCPSMPWARPSVGKA